jgi:hypothetical protein
VCRGKSSLTLDAKIFPRKEIGEFDLPNQCSRKSEETFLDFLCYSHETYPLACPVPGLLSMAMAYTLKLLALFLLYIYYMYIYIYISFLST